MQFCNYCHQIAHIAHLPIYCSTAFTVKKSVGLDNRRGQERFQDHAFRNPHVCLFPTMHNLRCSSFVATFVFISLCFLYLLIIVSLKYLFPNSPRCVFFIIQNWLQVLSPHTIYHNCCKLLSKGLEKMTQTAAVFVETQSGEAVSAAPGLCEKKTATLTVCKMRSKLNFMIGFEKVNDDFKKCNHHLQFRVPRHPVI